MIRKQLQYTNILCLTKMVVFYGKLKIVMRAFVVNTLGKSSAIDRLVGKMTLSQTQPMENK